MSGVRRTGDDALGRRVVSPKRMDISRRPPRKARVARALPAVLQAMGAAAFSSITCAEATLAPTAPWRRPANRRRAPPPPKGQTKIRARPAHGRACRRWRRNCASSAIFRPPRLPAPPVRFTRARSSQAVKRFQERHGLQNDGVIGAGTIRALNVPLAARVRQIELAMERMRWLPTLSDRPNVFVNVRAVSLVGHRSRDRRRAAADERGRRPVAQSSDADLRRADGIRDLPALLEPAAEYHGEGDRPARRDATRATWRTRTWRSSRAATTTRRRSRPTPENLVAGGRRPAARAPEARTGQLARPGQVHLPERRKRLHARHAGAAAVFARRAATSATAASGSRIRRASPSGCCAISRRGRASASRRRCRASGPTRVNLKQPLTVVIFYDTVHVNSEAWCSSSRHLRPRPGARRGADAGYPYPTKGSKQGRRRQCIRLIVSAVVAHPGQVKKALKPAAPSTLQLTRCQHGARTRAVLIGQVGHGAERHGSAWTAELDAKGLSGCTSTGG